MDSTNDGDTVAVYIVLICILPPVSNPYDDLGRANTKWQMEGSVFSVQRGWKGETYVLLTRLDEALETASTVGCTGFTTKGNRDGSKDGTLTTTIVTDDKVEVWTQIDTHALVTHKVENLNVFNRTSIRMRVLCMGSYLGVSTDTLRVHDMRFQQRA